MKKTCDVRSVSLDAKKSYAKKNHCAYSVAGSGNLQFERAGAKQALFFKQENKFDKVRNHEERRIIGVRKKLVME